MSESKMKDIRIRRADPKRFAKLKAYAAANQKPMGKAFDEVVDEGVGSLSKKKTGREER
ncbi:MAG: hypothetical protein IKE60_26495 [Reyranella sp.]|uniref:hypothetical protein n=1 Tax=Reyranella sp. TaxID=1929291 RepID=UPI0025EB4F0F|nr:hypothetical protein [Reyranella sp.]MBR2818240.1 hypothetical protein [Reyranella sp.]